MSRKSKNDGMNGKLVPILAIVVIILGAAYFIGQQTPATTLPTTAAITTPPVAHPGQIGVSTQPAAAGAKLDSGEFELFLKDSQGKTGTASSVLLLNAAAHWKGSESATRYSVMQILSEKGLDGLTAYQGGTPKAITPTSGEWSEAQLTGHINDQVLVFTYVDTTPAAVENVSYAKLMTLSDFYRETGKWVLQGTDGKSTWNLYNYANYTWMDGSDTIAHNYTYGDSGSVDTNQVITWYSRAQLAGELCNDCGIYIQSPSNYTAKFKSLTVTDKFGHSVKFTTLNKAENFPSGDPRSIGASVLTAALDPNYWYYVGAIPQDFVSLYTSGDKNRMTWELATDTYATNITVTVAVVQNANALISNNGAFEMFSNFKVALTSLTSTPGFDNAGRTL